MTETPSSDPRSDDELVSAVLDGEASAQERARVQADASLRERLAEFHAVSELVADVGDQPSADDLDRVRAAALDAVRSPTAAADEVVAPPPVQLAGRRRRPRRIELPSPALAAAFLVVLALIGIGLVIRGSSDSTSSNNAASAPTATAAEGQAEDNALEATRGDEPGAPLLGSFATQAELTRALAELDRTTLSPDGDAYLTTTSPAPTSTTTTSGAAEGSEPAEAPATQQSLAAAIDRCDQVVRAVPGQDLGERLAVAQAVLDDRRVLIYSHPRRRDDPAGEEVVLLTVVDNESCRILFAVQR